MTESAKFISGRELSRRLFAIIAPRMRAMFPEIPFAYALIGPGSDVLGYDTARSMDHDWGPRLTIVVPGNEQERTRERISTNLDELLPPSLAGFPARYSRHQDGTLFPDPNGVLHRLDVESKDSLLRQRLLIDHLQDLDDAVWLSTPMQVLLELSAGEVFMDEIGDLTNIREGLSFYPDHIWRYQLAGLWMRVAQVQPFIGRAAEVGDHAGSSLIGATIVRDFMRIGLLQSRQYAPYSKWLGSAFARTDIGSGIGQHLDAALATTDWLERERYINLAGSRLIEQLNALDLIDPVTPEPNRFHARPFHVLPAEDIVTALRSSLKGSNLLDLQATMGGIDVVTDSTDALGSNEFRLTFRKMMRGS